MVAITTGKVMNPLRDVARARESHRLLDVAGLPGRLALSPAEAAEALGVGITLFQEQIQPELRIVRIGRRRLIPVAELVAWLSANAEPTLRSEAR